MDVSCLYLHTQEFQADVIFLEQLLQFSVGSVTCHSVHSTLATVRSTRRLWHGNPWS